MTGVTATDAEDGDLTSRVTYDKPVNAGSVGAYRITYSVTDSDGNTTVKYGIALVGRGWVVKSGYALYAQDFAKKLSAVTGTSAEAVKFAKAMAVWVANAADANFGKQVSVSIASKGGYKKKAGKYKIKFAVTESKSVTKTITATVSDDKPTVTQVKTPTIKPPSVTVRPPNVTVNPPAPAPAAPAAPAVTPPPQIIEVPTPAPAVVEITPAAVEPPLSPPEPMGAWHLLDLLLVIFSTVLGFFLMAFAMRRREEEEERLDGWEYRGSVKDRRIPTWGQFGLALGIASVVVLILTQDFSAPMLMTDTWTALFAIIFGVELLAVYGVTRTARNETNETDEYYD
jgi:hypothetical protein